MLLHQKAKPNPILIKIVNDIVTLPKYTFINTNYGHKECSIRVTFIIPFFLKNTIIFYFIYDICAYLQIVYTLIISIYYFYIEISRNL